MTRISTVLTAIRNLGGRLLHMAFTPSRLSEARYLLLAENARDIIWMMDMNLQYTYVNPYVQQLLDYTPEEYMALPLNRALTSSSLDACMKVLAEELEIEKKADKDLLRSRTLEAEPIDKHGKIVPVEIKLTFIRNSHGVATGILGYTRNITDRKQAMEAVRKSEDKYRTLIETTGTGFVIIDQDGLVQDANPEYVRLTGHRHLTEIIGRSVIEWTADYEKEKNAAAVKSCFDKGYIRNLEIDYMDLRGNITPIEINATCMELEGKTCTLTICRDITERKRAEDAVHQSEEKYRTILESIEEGYFEQNLPGDFIFLSDSMYRIYGYPKEELLGMNYKQYTDIESGRKCLHVYRKILNTGQPGKVIDFEIIRKDGTRRHIESSVSLQKDSSGNPIAFRGIVRDVTESKMAEAQLKEAEQKFRTIADFTYDWENWIGVDGKVIWISPSVERVTGYSISECMAMPDYPLPMIHPEDHGLILSKMREANERPLNYIEFRIISKDKAIKWGAVSTNPVFTEDGRSAGHRSSIRDITERKMVQDEKQRLEERLQRAGKMEALGTLAGGVAHDLNNVLGVIVGYSELLLSEVDPLSPIRPRLMSIMSGSERAAAIVQDLLTLARRGVPGRRVLNLNKIIQDYKNSLELDKLASDHPAVRIKTDLEPDLLNISGSSVHLDKALSNLVLNAVEAMPKGGNLTIKTANQYIDKPIYGYDEVREGDYVVLTVTDTGEGIPAADLQRIFEPFYTKKVMGRSGTGLGLAVIWGTVKDHQGYINVQSKEGSGSIFTLYFPVTREEASVEAASVSVSEYMGKDETILVVDDVKEQRELAAAMLKKLNYNVSITASGEEAVAYIREHTIDLLVLDMIMDPGMDGLDTYKKVLAIQPKQKAIIVSGFSETHRVNEAHALGAGAYLRKPYVMEKLGLTVRRELDRK